MMAGWVLHFMVLLSFTVQVTLLLLSDIRRRRDWAWLKVVIWSAYLLADTTAIFALGHMSVLCNWSPEKQLMALWAPLLLVHLGGLDNITAYAIEDNRLWLRHLQTFVLQVAAAGYVLYASSIIFHPSKLRSAAILMFVVGVLKYGERIWALVRADSCCSSSLSATSYDKASVSSRTAAGVERNLARAINYKNSQSQKKKKKKYKNSLLIQAYSLLDVPKKMFEGPTAYVQISSDVEYPTTYVQISSDEEISSDDKYAKHVRNVVEMQLWMMYDLLYTKAAVVHTWYGLCSRVFISLPFTVAALALFRSLLSHIHDKDGYYRRVDIAITNVLLIGAVVLEIMSVLRAVFSKWTAVLMYARGWNRTGDMVFAVTSVVTGAIRQLTSVITIAIGLLGEFCLHTLSRHSECICIRSATATWANTCGICLYRGRLGRMGQHNLFVLMSHHYKYSVGRKMTKRMRLEDWWDSNVYSSSTDVPELAIKKVLDLLSSTTIEEITKSWGHNAVRRRLNKEQPAWIWTEEEMNLEDRILVWHIATNVFTRRYADYIDTLALLEAIETLSNYMFFLLAASPYMLPYPVSRQAYAQLCSDAETHLPDCSLRKLHNAVVNQKAALLNGTPLQPDAGIGGAAQPQTQRSMNTTLDRGCQLAAKLLHLTAGKTEVRYDGKGKGIAEQAESSVRGEDIIREPGETVDIGVLDMVLEVWVEMLCYTAYLCNENSHAKHLTNGGEIMTPITLMMIYKKNGLFQNKGKNTEIGFPLSPRRYIYSDVVLQNSDVVLQNISN